MKVRLTPAALDDIDGMYQALVPYGQSFAGRVESAVFDALDVFARFPQFGVLSDELNVYRWPMGEFRYTIFYRIRWEKGEIEVLRIINGKRLRNLRRRPR
jgi:plasmid stabilization system protein ParE